MARENIIKINIECELGASNRFRFLGTLTNGSSQALATGVGGQNLKLFKDLLKKLAEVYSVHDAITVEVQNSQIIGLP